MKKLLFAALASAGLAGLVYAGGGYISGQQAAPSQGGTGTSTVFTQGSVIFSGASGVYTQNNSQFFWDNTNNRLGLGTAAPSVTFHGIGAVASRAVFVNSPNASMVLSAGTLASEIAVFASPYSASNTSMLDLLAFSTMSVNPMYRITNHWEQSSGNTSSSGTIAIGSYVGTTYSDVLAITTTNAVAIGSNFYDPLATLHVVSTSTTGAWPAFRVDNNAKSSLMRVRQDGIVAIGGTPATDPGYIFDIKAAANQHIGFGAGNVADIRAVNDAGAAFQQLDLDGAPLRLNPGNSGNITMVITGGSVGINTATPNTKLHMSSGTLTVDGTAAAILVAPTSTALAASTMFQAGASTLTARTDGQVMLSLFTVTFINQQLTPVQGGLVTCTNCVRPYTVCIGTGTALGQWREQGQSGLGAGCY